MLLAVPFNVKSCKSALSYVNGGGASRLIIITTNLRNLLEAVDPPNPQKIIARVSMDQLLHEPFDRTDEVENVRHGPDMQNLFLHGLVP